MQSAKEKPQQVELAQWVTRLAKLCKNPGDAVAKTGRSGNQEESDVGAKILDVDVGDKVWVFSKRESGDVAETRVSLARHIFERMAAWREARGAVGA
jgi:hypothetical protein